MLIPAAGRGERLGGDQPKQFRTLAGRPMLLHALRPFASHPAVAHIVIALPAPDAARPPGWLAELVGGRLSLVPGDATRAGSVRRALAALSGACTVVLVHDAARPLVTREEIDAVIAGARAGAGAVPALPVADTLKRADQGRVTGTADRAGLWRALTPQGFPRALLEGAFARATALDATDDAGLVEAAGGEVRLVPGSPRNIKITTAADLAVAECLARP